MGIYKALDMLSFDSRTDRKNLTLNLDDSLDFISRPQDSFTNSEGVFKVKVPIFIKKYLLFCKKHGILSP